jgi:hypothetical protein
MLWRPPASPPRLRRRPPLSSPRRRRIPMTAAVNGPPREIGLAWAVLRALPPLLRLLRITSAHRQRRRNQGIDAIQFAKKSAPNPAKPDKTDNFRVRESASKPERLSNPHGRPTRTNRFTHYVSAFRIEWPAGPFAPQLRITDIVERNLDSWSLASSCFSASRSAAARGGRGAAVGCSPLRLAPPVLARAAPRFNGRSSRVRDRRRS